MKKERRVTKNYEFTDIIQNRKLVKSTSFIVYYRPKAQEHARIGISVGKKLGNAVIRNRIKRQIRGMVDEVFDFHEDYDYIIIARPAFLKRTWQDAKEELQYCRRRASQRDRRKKES